MEVLGRGSASVSNASQVACKKRLLMETDRVKEELKSLDRKGRSCVLSLMN